MPTLAESYEIVRAGARCAGRSDIMFGSKRRLAKSMCRPCPVAEVCLWRTMTLEGDAQNDERFGIVAGFSSPERSRLNTSLSPALIAANLRMAIIRYRAGLPARFPPPVRQSPKNQAVDGAETVATRIAVVLGTTLEVLKQHDRSPEPVRRRDVAIAVCRNLGFSFPVIGVVFDRDHSAVMDACRRVEDNPQLTACLRSVGESIERLEARIAS